jgi:hypothetical protein
MKQPIDPADLSLGYGLDFQTISNYYPFGMQMPGMSWSEGSGYRYGFGSHENDDEVYGNDNFMDFGGYGYDNRLGRRWNVEPYIAKLASKTSYITFNNNPILNYDPDGNIWKIVSSPKYQATDYKRMKSIISKSFDNKVIAEINDGIITLKKVTPEVEFTPDQHALYKTLNEVIESDRTAEFNIGDNAKDAFFGRYGESKEHVYDQGALDLKDIESMQEALPSNLFNGWFGHEIGEQLLKFSDKFEYPRGLPYSLAHDRITKTEDAITGWDKIEETGPGELTTGTLGILYRTKGTAWSTFWSNFGLAEKPEYKTLRIEIENNNPTRIQLLDGKKIDDIKNENGNSENE